jgi:hypothetical protein
LNRTLGYLALIGRNVIVPRSAGVWVIVGDAVRAPWEVADLVAAAYPGIDVHRLAFIALLTDFEVEEFEAELQAGQSQPRDARPDPKMAASDFARTSR